VKTATKTTEITVTTTETSLNQVAAEPDRGTSVTVASKRVLK